MDTIFLYELRFKTLRDRTLKSIRVKMLQLGEDGNPHHIKLELSSQNDLFLHYRELQGICSP
jgi:hypothetical protein